MEHCVEKHKVLNAHNQSVSIPHVSVSIHKQTGHKRSNKSLRTFKEGKYRKLIERHYTALSAATTSTSSSLTPEPLYTANKKFLAGEAHANRNRTTHIQCHPGIQHHTTQNVNTLPKLKHMMLGAIRIDKNRHICPRLLPKCTPLQRYEN